MGVSLDLYQVNLMICLNRDATKAIYFYISIARQGSAERNKESAPVLRAGSLTIIKNYMNNEQLTEAAQQAMAVVRRNTEEVQGKGNYEVFEELFDEHFVDYTPQPGSFSADRDGAKALYKKLREAFPDFHAAIHWQYSDGDKVTTFKTYHGTHQGEFWGLAPTGKKIQFETVDVMSVRNGKITGHWGVANLFSLAQQLGIGPKL
jgi:predicted ester cyclase